MPPVQGFPKVFLCFLWFTGSYRNMKISAGRRGSAVYFSFYCRIGFTWFALRGARNSKPLKKSTSTLTLGFPMVEKLYNI